MTQDLTESTDCKIVQTMKSPELLKIVKNVLKLLKKYYFDTIFSWKINLFVFKR